ncbi:hypothetical protein IFR05_005375 [Cadophora sp. M221]|nr:hypothetical protein IFR05_005375 [Cadophora sp. M221]
MPYPYEVDVNRHHNRPFEGPRRDGRIDAARAMEEAGGRGMLKHVAIRFGDIESLLRMNQSVALPDLVSPLIFDPLSAALRVYSQQLVSLELLGCVDQTLFWPGEREVGIEPFWPRVKNLKATFHPAAPSGRWYFQGPKGVGRDSTGFAVGSGHYPPTERQEMDEEWDEDWGRYENTSPNMFRTKPIDEEVEGLLGAFARALDVMPVLEVAELVTYLDFAPDDDEDTDLSGLETRRIREMEVSSRDVVCRWGMKYIAGGVDSRLEWYVGGWGPSWGLEKVFCSVVPRERWVFL